MSLDKILPSYLKVTPIKVVNNKEELFTIYTSDRRKASKMLADIIAAVMEVKNDRMG